MAGREPCAEAYRFFLYPSRSGENRECAKADRYVESGMACEESWVFSVKHRQFTNDFRWKTNIYKFGRRRQHL